MSAPHACYPCTEIEKIDTLPDERGDALRAVRGILATVIRMCSRVSPMYGLDVSFLCHVEFYVFLFVRFTNLCLLSI